MGIASPALLVLTAAAALLALVSAVGGLRSLRRGHGLAFTARSLSALVFAALCASCVLLVMATRGYQALTREDLAVEVHVQPAGRHAFVARFVFPDGREVTHHLSGDQLYVDAHILKWKPVANLMGLHTAYELDRVAGRYASLADEQSQPRSVYSLAGGKSLDLFDLRQKYAPLAFLVDAEYGSATFVDVKLPATLQIRVSTTGLLIRPKPGAP